MGDGPLYSLPNYSNVSEPSEDELAEVDMALYEADLSSPPDAECVSAWYRSGAIQAALAAAGDSDGSMDWFCDFTENLIGYMDDQGAADPELVELVVQWDAAVAYWNGDLGRVSRRIPRQLLLRTNMTLPACAQLLGITEEQLVDLLFPASHDQLRAAADDYRAAVRPNRELQLVARRHGLDKRMLSDWFRLIERAEPEKIGLEWLTTCREMWVGGLQRRDLIAEAKRRGLFPVGMSDDTFYTRVRRYRPELVSA